ncbi:MAG TPA: Rossmann-like and DUF2520 domain-containing protein [Candidatus Angelobacter sp.]|jgi:predicted short-subunit dehydrogenase-like oxidoreductase (DUF2520 family)|nr:Rossmann-like and DUF2520 domain-containing protein [Candidatus Angelobacter sp.]
MLTQQMPETLSIVGAGRVGKALGRCLHDLGWRVGVVATRSIPTARAAVRAIGAGDPADHLTRQVLASKVVLIATPDDVIADVATELAHLGGNEWRDKVVLHTSGSLDSSVLGPLADAGAETGSIHPMQTFSGQSVPDLAGCVFGIEGSPKAMKVARKMIRQTGGVAARLNGGNKAAYHAAGSIACGQVLALLETATRLLMAQGFTRRQAARALLPLTRQTLDNFERIGPRAAWTGPMARGDFSTVQRHVDALSDFPPEYQDAYKVLSRLAAAVLSDDSSALLQKLDGIFGPRQKGAEEKKVRKKSAAG